MALSVVKRALCAVVATVAVAFLLVESWPSLSNVRSIAWATTGRVQGRRLSESDNATLASAATGVNTCPGAISVGGLGSAKVVAAQWNQPGKPAGPVTVSGGSISTHMWGRAYLASSCSRGVFNNEDYYGVKLLGKKLKYTTDLSQAGCGCNAAMYLVPMQKNTQATGCDDYYCDANWVCGASCAEIDVQEANKFAWHTALHKEYDTSGVAAGYGGWVHNNNKYSFDSDEYGPGARCINTRKPFHVTAAFPESGGRLKSMDVTLSQGGCSVSLSHKEYPADPGFALLSRALAEGMTPVVSYWKSSDMLWMDGPGMGDGPCKADSQQCGSSAQFYGFSVER